MPPRAAPSQSRGGSRGGPRGGSPSRGRGGPPSRGGGPASGPGGDLPAAHILTIGVKRPGFGTLGRPLDVFTNFFETKLPERIIHHYDVVILPSEKTLPPRLNMALIEQLQTVVAPEVFTPRAVYDGRKNLFSIRELPFANGTSQEFDVNLSANRGSPTENTTRPPKIYKIRLTKVAEINPEVLNRFIQGQQSHDNNVLTAITALNVVVRMEPTMKYPFNVRSFFTDRETKDIGLGLILWRGYFQSVRPALGKMLINVDISTGTMYKQGPLISLCLEYLMRRQPQDLAQLQDRERIQLQRFISGVRVSVNTNNRQPRVIKKLTSAGANQITFSLHQGGQMTVAQYFQQTVNRPLRFPSLPCVEVGSGALLPLEVCEVVPGQIMRKQVPPEKTKDVLEFATKKPQDRLASIRRGLEVLAYDNSEYVNQFGMGVQSREPLKIKARVLPPPKLKYSNASRQPIITPQNGAWNMVDKKFISPAAIEAWAIVIYERPNRFSQQQARDMVKGLMDSCSDVGMRVAEQDPIIKYENGQGRIADQLRAAGMACNQKNKRFPNLIVVILPDSGNDIYTAVKHFGDISTGVATQCMKSSKAFRAKPQYYANVCLKINVKLGGINTIPDPQSVAILTDPRIPTIVMGADVMHPAPGSDGRPSFTSLVANVDSDTAKYIADSRVQTSRQEMIEDLQAMSKHVLSMYMKYRQNVEKKGANSAPKRIIFYRDGVSEGQFKHVLDMELQLLKKACQELGINPTITFIIVGKRHHVRFFPQREGDGDRSGNCPAGTVVDREVGHPTEFDFYLQSHGGLLGTSRPAHYNVLYDDNGFNPDGLQSLSFALCHVYARSTRSVSIPAPVYYADIVCARAKNHYDPQGQDAFDFSDSATQLDSNAARSTLQAFKSSFKPLHKNMASVMYFS